MLTAQDAIKEFELLPDDQRQIFLNFLYDQHSDVRQLNLLKVTQTLAKVGSWEWDIAHDKISWSDELFKLFGEDKESFIPSFENYLSLIHPDDKDLVLAIIHKALENHQSYQMSHRIQRKDGTIGYVTSRGEVILTDGTPSKMLGTAQDITESKLAEQKFKSLLESAPDAMLIVNKMGIIELTNKQTELLFGYKKSELIGQKVEFLIPSRFHSKHKNNRKSYQENANSRPMGQGLELFGLHKEGSEIPVEISLSPIYNNGEKLVSAAIRDITQRKEIEKKQQDLYNQLEKSNTELENFAYIISHDLKAPLRSIAAVSEWIQEDLKEKGSAAEGKNWEILISQIEKMYTLIDGVLEYSRVGRITEDLKAINLNALVHSIFEMYVNSNNIKFKIDEELPVIRFEPIKAQQIFQNIISNSVNAIGASKGDIAVGFKTEKDSLVFYVKDNGPGLEEKYFEKIFVISQSLDATGESKSTGIGLTIVKKIIESYKGKIWIESDLGKGASFYFSLPNPIRAKN
ncbi:MAG: PAS domain S-box-containing protein [Flavobacteriales bacterium]|jgi:PAS domain S-box-containing protein